MLPPSVNDSEDKFTVEPEGIRFGLGAVKSVGRGRIIAMVENRQKEGKFSSFEDFIRRMDKLELNKRAVENLIKCGACDCFGLYRSQMLAVYETMMDSMADSRKRNVEGQLGLFGMLAADEPASAIPIPKLPELQPGEKWPWKRKLRGCIFPGILWITTGSI